MVISCNSLLQGKKKGENGRKISDEQTKSVRIARQNSNDAKKHQQSLRPTFFLSNGTAADPLTWGENAWQCQDRAARAINTKSKDDVIFNNM